MSDHEHVWIADGDRTVCTHCQMDLKNPLNHPAQRTVTITIVPEEACPTCGAYSGHPDSSLDFFNRPKVALADGIWWWRCYNPACSTGYYNPETGEIE